MTNNPDISALVVEIQYLKNTLDEIRKDHLPAIRQAIKDEVSPLEIRISDIENEIKVIDKNVWVMFGALKLIIPVLVTTIIGLGIAYLVNSGG